MGILSSLKKGVMKVMDTATVAFTHPIQTISAVISPTKTVAQVVEKHFEQPVTKQITEIVLTTAGYATAALGVAGIAAKGIAATASSLIPSTIKGKIIAAVAAPVIIGAVVQEPAKITKIVTKAPSELAQFGGDIAKFVSDPSLESAKQIIKESPVISGVVAAAAAVGIGAAAVPAISGYLTREEMEKQTAALEAQVKATEATNVGAISTLPYPSSTAPAPIPVTPQTETVMAGGIKVSPRRKRRISVAVMPSVRQNVNVIVQNRNFSTGIRHTKNYLNYMVLAH